MLTAPFSPLPKVPGGVAPATLPSVPWESPTRALTLSKLTQTTSVSSCIILKIVISLEETVYVFKHNINPLDKDIIPPEV